MERECDDIDASRMQWIGLLSAIINFKLLEKYLNNNQRKNNHCHIGCCNRKVVTQINKYQHDEVSTGMYGGSNMDLILQILEEINNLKDQKIGIYVELVEKTKN